MSEGKSGGRGPHAALGFILCGPLTAIKNIHCAALSEILRHFKISNSDLVPQGLTSPELYTSSVRNLGVTFDKNLTFADHITKLSQTCYMHIRDLRRLRP